MFENVLKFLMQTKISGIPLLGILVIVGFFGFVLIVLTLMQRVKTPPNHQLTAEELQAAQTRESDRTRYGGGHGR